MTTKSEKVKAMYMDAAAKEGITDLMPASRYWLRSLVTSLASRAERTISRNIAVWKTDDYPNPEYYKQHVYTYAHFVALLGYQDRATAARIAALADQF